MKVIQCDELNSEVIEKIKQESNVYWSKEYDSFLVTEKTCDYLFEKYKLTRDWDSEEDTHVYCFNTIQEWIECIYEQEDYEFMGKSYDYYRFSESTRLQLDDMVNEETQQIVFVTDEDWSKDVDKYLKVEMSIYIMSKLRDSLVVAKQDGFDINVLKTAFNNI
jgi:hypothetical protein